MSDYTLRASIHERFQFLLDEFHFSISEERYDQEMRNAVVVFSSGNTQIEVVKDRGQILASLGDQRLSRWDWVEFAEAIQHFSKLAEPVYQFPGEYNDITEQEQIIRVSSLMEKYCVPLLSGSIDVVQLRKSIDEQRRNETRKFLNNFGASNGDLSG